VSDLPTPERLSDKKLDEIAMTANRWIVRRARAEQRLAAMNGRHWCFALLGMHSDVDSFDFGSAALRLVTEPPGEVELAGAIRNKTLFGAIGRYSHSIRYELAVNRIVNDDDEAAWSCVGSVDTR
jgi:hypothetical protein